MKFQEVWKTASPGRLRTKETFQCRDSNVRIQANLSEEIPERPLCRKKYHVLGVRTKLESTILTKPKTDLIKIR